MNLQTVLGPINLAVKQLKDVTDDPIFDKKVNQPVDESAGNFKLTANVGAEVKVKLFNSKDDDDSDDLAKSLQLDNAIDAGSAFLSYDVIATLDSSIALTQNEIKLGIKASGSVRHVTFTRHQNTEKLGEAVLADLLDLKTIINSQSVLGLKDEEAVALFTTASFEFNGSFKISEAFTPVLGALSKLIGTATPIKASMEMAASFTASVAIKDDLSIVIQCVESAGGVKSFIVDIKKDYSKDLSFGGSLSLVASIGNPDVIKDRITDLIGQGEKIIIEKAEQFRNSLPVSAADIETLKKAAAKIGVDVDGTIADIKQKYFDKKDKIVDKIEEILKTNITLAASVEYQKQMSEQSLLHGKFTAAAITAQFRNIIRAKVFDIYQASSNPANGMTELSFAQINSISITRTLKFGLTIGDFFELSDTIKKSKGLKQTLKADGKGEYQDVQVSSNKIVTKKMGVFEKQESSLMLDGSFTSNSVAEVKVKDLAFDFTVKWSQSYKKLDESTFKATLDFGLTWRIFDKAYYDSQLSIYETLKKKKVSISAVLAMKNGSFSKILSGINSITDDGIASITSASLPWSDFLGRRTPEERIKAYKLFVTVLANTRIPIDYDTLRSDTSIALHKLSPDYDALSTFEGVDHPNSTNTQLAAVFWVNAFPYHFKDSFRRSIARIIENGDSPVKAFIDANLSDDMLKVPMKDVFGFNPRFLGVMALQLSAPATILNDIERTLTIDYTDDSGTDQKIVYTK